MTSGAVQVGGEPGTAVPQADSKNLPLEQSEVVALWIHYEERATEIKGQMYGTLTFLNTALLSRTRFLVGGGSLWGRPD